jgi:hypothetical protein
MKQTIQCNTYGDAVKAALDWLEARGITNLNEAFKARLGGYGMRTLDGSSGYRIEYDERSKAHINVWHHKDPGPHFTFRGNEQDVEAKKRQLFFWDPKLKRRIVEN